MIEFVNSRFVSVIGRPAVEGSKFLESLKKGGFAGVRHSRSKKKIFRLEAAERRIEILVKKIEDGKNGFSVRLKVIRSGLNFLEIEAEKAGVLSKLLVTMSSLDSDESFFNFVSIAIKLTIDFRRRDLLQVS